MGGYDLTQKEDRLKLADLAFTYPKGLHVRKHGPRYTGTGWEIYRDWVRDEFQYRCVFSLVREVWPSTQFHIDHLVPRAERKDLTCEYDNLLYLTSQLNLKKGKRSIPDPCKYDLAKCLRLQLSGDRFGLVEALNEAGQFWEAVFRLNSEDAVAERRKLIGILRSVAIASEPLFRELIGYPKSSLPDLESKSEDDNSRPEGKARCAFAILRAGHLPDYY